MTHRSAVPVSPAFESIARGAQFRDRIAVVVKAPPETISRALHEVTLRDMKFAWLLGELRYLPSRLAGHMPAADSRRPFMNTLIEGGTLVLRDDSPHELITGSAAQLHRVNQTPRRFTTREAFDTFTDPNHEKLFMITLLAFEPERHLMLGWRPNDTLVMTWAFVLNEVTSGSCRLVVRAREGAGYHFHALPRWLTSRIGPVVHFIMQRQQLLGIKRRAESTPVDALVSADRSPTADKDAA